MTYIELCIDLAIKKLYYDSEEEVEYEYEQSGLFFVLYSIIASFWESGWPEMNM